ncbi:MULTISPECIES: hypothetical protein [unclassified Shewanella]|uniref:hypothetical protein n=1 Tax=unclassified Shewanella TaxID=196818 RepID=UPI001BBA4A7A|nr:MULTISPECIES: hypothetical protein [unclassified Shewanella]GIU08432.1 hypothetical protein TUM4444_09470 [Shewanella sp. MBTL60-112-B1]GIU35362.1 hypothetical protein TUM4445_25110 [Shewanella sp. MBTL60-112-B2]
MLFAIVLLLMYSGYSLGHSAFKAGLPVKRWVVAGTLVGPAAYPLFNSHKQLVYRKAMGKQGISIIL